MSSQTNRLSKQSVTSAWMKRSLGRDMYVHVCVVRKRRDEKRREERETEGGREGEGRRKGGTNGHTDRHFNLEFPCLGFLINNKHTPRAVVNVLSCENKFTWQKTSTT